MAQKYGLDISSIQTNVDFKQIKKEGYTFVILRMNEWSNKLKCSVKDSKFEEYYYKAKEVGLHVGAYWFSYANTVDYCVGEAKTAIEWLKGKKFEYPIYFDLEREKQFNQGKKVCTAMVEAFCQEMEKNGFFVGVYCSTYWYTNYVDEKTRQRYACWIAEWDKSKPTYKGTYGMWQNGITRCVGVNNNASDVDHDICYVDYPTTIVGKGFNGYSKKVLDDTSFLVLGETSALCFILKKILVMACEKNIIHIEQTNNLTYDYAAQRAVNNLLEIWGYTPNGNVGKNFLDKAWAKVVKGV